MNDPKTRDLVDRYLMNVASPEELSRLSQMRSADPLFNRYVEECESTFEVIRAARTLEFRKKLKSWDESEKRKRKKGMLLFITLVLSFLLFWSWVVIYFSPAALATRSFQRINPYPGQTVIQDNTDLWHQGRNAFMRRQFRLAHSYFSEIKSSAELEVHTNQWNMLLCEFAETGPTEGLEKKIQSHAVNLHDPLQKEASCLYQIMQSPFYQLLYTKILGNSVKLVRPGIM